MESPLPVNSYVEKGSGSLNRKSSTLICWNVVFVCIYQATQKGIERTKRCYYARIYVVLPILVNGLHLNYCQA